jgi:two-component system sensor histidine kinase UhpB
MGAQNVLFLRRYRAALLDYLLGNRETELARAYDLGRKALADGHGLLEVLRTHQRAMHAIIEASHNPDETLKKLDASWEFLTEMLSPFEMTTRGYVSSLGRHVTTTRKSRRRPQSRITG